MVPSRIDGDAAQAYTPTMSTEFGVGAFGPVHEFPLVIHEGHLDTFGHVNNATYLQLFEQARWDWTTRGGYGLEKIQETQRGPIILDCTVQFRRELTNRRAVVIRSWIDELRPKIAKVRQDIIASGATGGEPELYCSATFTMAFFDLAARRIIEPSEAWLGVFGLNTQDLRRDP